MAIYLRGVGGAPGIALGRAVRYMPETLGWQAADADAETALARFAAARAAASQQLQQLAEVLRAEGRAEEARIFDAQALLVEDEFLAEDVARRIREGHVLLEQAVVAATAQMRAMLDMLDDPYLRERSVDMDAISRAILTSLRGESRRLHDLPAGAILVASDLTPAETVSLRGGPIAGFVTAEGGPTSHTAILARAFGIPAVVGLGAATLAVPDGASLILDGAAALLIVEPDAYEWAGYERRASGQLAAHIRRQALRDQPGRLADGHPVTLWANVGSLAEARLAVEQGAEGVGLFRTEFLFLGRAAPPDEAEQLAACRELIDVMGGRTITARTLDVGGDKSLAYLDLPHEANPALGTRGLRLCMRRPDLFQTQLRALLRAAAHGDLRIMLPMVTTPDDLAWGLSQIRAAAQSLARDGLPHRADLPVGVMIETPAAAVTADLLARDAAFFSVGSNDLAQYTLATDRCAADLTTRYRHDSPAVLRLIAQAVGAAARARIPISVCGELAGVAAAAPLLVGMGIFELSMNPGSILAVKEHLHAITLSQARGAARRALGE